MRNFHFLMVCLVAVMPLGCANWNAVQPGEKSVSGPEGSQSADPTLLMATDFVNALRQIREVLPQFTTVQLLSTSSSDPFTVSMQTALKAAGYGIRWVTDDAASEHLVQYRRVREASSGTTHRDIYEVAVGKVEMRRTYLMSEGNKVKPITPLYVRGTDASNIVLNDSAFETIEAPQMTQNQSVAIAAPVPLKPEVTRSSTSSESPSNAQRTLSINNHSRLAVPDEANPLQGLVSNATHANSLTMPLIALPRVENVFELGGSNYEDVLAGYHTVEEKILTFPNDSLRLGGLNKRFVEKMVLRFDPVSDVFSLIGCSLGPTKLEGGNAALALGRSSRVREALLFAGVPQDKILDEGCWAGDSTDNTLPRRGVVVTLNRRT